MNLEEAERYLKSKGANCWKKKYYGITLSESINKVEGRIKWAEWPVMLLERSQWGNPHYVVVKGYNDISKKFYLNDPNTLTGASTMFWYHEDCAPFNFEDNVYRYVGADDLWDDGITFVE